MKIDVLLGRIFLAIISCLAIFLLLEFASRWLLPARTENYRLNMIEHTDSYRKPKPYVMFGGAPNAKYSNDERLNGNGYRGKAPLQQKPDGEFRVFLLGGSTVVYGSPPLPELLEKLFRKHGHRNVSVYNYGVISSVSGMDLARILFEIADFHPDLIVMYNGGNDLGSPPYYDPRPGYPFNFLVYESNPLLESNHKTYPTLLMTAYGSNLLRRLFPKFFMEHLVPMAELRQQARLGTKEWEDSMVSCYVRNLIKADKVSKSLGAQFIAFYQPLVYYKKSVTSEEQVWFGAEVKDYMYMRDQIRAQVGSYRKQAGLNFVDASDLFADTKGTVFTDTIHLTDESNSIVAEELYKQIVLHVKLPAH